MFRKLNLIFLFFALSLTSGISSLEAAELYAVLVGDTKDEPLGTAFEKSLEMMQAEINRISKKTDLKLNLTVFQGDTLTPERVFSCLKMLPVKSDDVVFLYFSMHGFRTYLKFNKWPSLFFGVAQEGAHFEDFNKIILKKKPRLLVSLADCCNNRMLPFVIPMVGQQLLRQATVPNEDLIKANCRKLFLDKKGSVIASGAEPGDYSWYYVGVGGIFTMNFLETLKQGIQSEKGIDWGTLMDITSVKTVQETKTFEEHQNPQFEIK